MQHSHTFTTIFNHEYTVSKCKVSYPHQVGQDSDVHNANVDEAVLPREASPRLNQRENNQKWQYIYTPYANSCSIRLLEHHRHVYAI